MMRQHDARPENTPCECTGRPGDKTARSFWRRWLLANTLVSGCFALAWLLLRSGTKPSRFAYPCQQAALSTATLALGGPLVGTLIAARQRLLSALRTPAGLVTAVLGLFIISGTWVYLSQASAYDGPRLDPPRGYRAEVFHVNECPQDPVGDRFVGLEHLLTMMGRHGLKLYQSHTETILAGPEGLIAPNDVVVIKINYQWGERGGSNVDVLRGLIRRLVEHPDGFTGEIVVCENAQFNSINNFDRAQNNAQDHSLSPHDVVVQFQGEGYNVSHYDWTVRRYTLVEEYSAGNLTDGYVRYAYDSQLHGRISYPKFQTSAGTYVSLKYGLWDPAGESYDRAHLKFINLPVLKSHSATYGATACVKNYMGVVTRELSTSSHNAIRYGLLGALQAEIQPADLYILDCIWINANPNDGPWTSYAGATRRDELVASIDPVATDLWAVKNILIPAFLANGYRPPWPYPSADPDNPGSQFREYLDNSMNWMLAGGYDVTNDPNQIDLFTWNGVGDLDGDGEVGLSDLASLLSNYGTLGSATYYDGDLDGDGDVNLSDLSTLLAVYGTGCD